jgi:ribosomal protein S6--L-glutamate ligase
MDSECFRREAMSGRVLVDPEQQYLLGQPTTDNLKELYKNSEKATTGLCIGVLASNPELYSNKR